MAAIVVVTGKKLSDGKFDSLEDDIYHGPFCNGEQATDWANHNLSGFIWHWQDMNRPGTTYGTAYTDDIVDFIGTAHKDGRDCYVTIDDVNWMIPIE